MNNAKTHIPHFRDENAGYHASIQDLFADAEIGDTSDKLIHERKKYRAVFISDTHMGSSSNCADNLVRFLNHIDTQYLVLVGDIMDFWSMGRRFISERELFRGSEQTVIQKLFRMSRHGVKIPCIPGNHDGLPAFLLSKRFSPNILFTREAVHETADGRRFLVVHGDEFDRVVRRFRRLSIVATRAYERLARFSLRIDVWRQNRGFDYFMNHLGFEPHWSFAHAIKTRSDRSTYTPAYERAMLRYVYHKNAKIFARRKNQLEGEKEPYFDGIIHGHTHTVSERTFDSEIDKKTGAAMGPREIICYDTGHWTGRPTNESNSIDESWRDKLKHPTCTALVEHFDGRMELVEWRGGIMPVTPQRENGPAEERERAMVPSRVRGKNDLPVAARFAHS